MPQVCTTHLLPLVGTWDSLFDMWDRVFSIYYDIFGIWSPP